MYKFLWCIFLIVSQPAAAKWDPSVLVGQWENYHYDYGHDYTRIVIDKNFNGSYIHIWGKNTDGVKFGINKDNFEFHEGYAIINLENQYKFILSAWGGSDSKRLLGQLFIYINKGEELELINSITINLYSATDESFLEFSKRVKNIQSKKR